jgi:hypothetical protein
MSVSLHPSIRAFLRNTDGATVKQVFDHVGGTINAVSRALREMPDTYVDRWNASVRGQYQAVHCLADVPEDCPKPRRSAK